MVKKFLFVLVSTSVVLFGFRLDHQGVGATGLSNGELKNPAAPDLNKGEEYDPDHPIRPPNTDKESLSMVGGVPASKDSATPNLTGGPDNFGYTWSDEITYSWVTATTDLGISEDDDYIPLTLGFSFPYFEQTWSEVYATTNGVLIFGDADDGCCGGLPIPSPATPNNMIVPFSEDLMVGAGYNNGGMYTLQGGIAPNRYFVIEWREVTVYGDYYGDPYTFQAILHENGDIVFQYQTISDTWYWYTIGIEDSDGLDGLEYPWAVGADDAILFERPDPDFRLKIRPPYQGVHTYPNNSISYQITISNTGELGPDTYNMFDDSVWPITLYHSDGITTLEDTNGDFIADSGSVPQGGSVTIVAKVQTPADAALGDNISVVITAESINNPAKADTATLQAALPARFAQTYVDVSDDTLMTYLAQPYTQTAKAAAPANPDIWGSAIAETPGFVQVWSKYGNFYDNIEFTLLDDTGEINLPATALTDNSTAVVEIYDLAPAVAVAPNGYIGVLWYRNSVDDMTGDENDNVWFAILNPSGVPVYGPQNITNNSVWGWRYDAGVPRFHQPVITATGDNRFVLSWSYEVDYDAGCSSDCSIDNVYYKVHGHLGTEVKAVTLLTDDVLDANKRHDDSNLTALSGNNALLVWECDDNISLNDDICYVVMNSSGIIIQSTTNISNYAYASLNPDAIQVLGGNTIITWQNWISNLYQITFAVLDESYAPVAGPTLLDNPAGLTGNSSPSIAASGSKAVITWADAEYDLNLYYALVNSSGSVLTPPMIFLSAQSMAYPYIFTNYFGYGNTSYTIETLLYLPVVLK